MRRIVLTLSIAIACALVLVVTLSVQADRGGRPHNGLPLQSRRVAPTPSSMVMMPAPEVMLTETISVTNFTPLTRPLRLNDILDEILRSRPTPVYYR